MEFKELLEKFMTTDSKVAVRSDSNPNNKGDKANYNYRTIFETRIILSNNSLNRKNRSTLKT